MTPPNEQAHLDELVSAGFPPMRVLGEPGAHGAAVTGVQGIGVRTPNAAAVADATAGLASEVQTPNGMMFTKGLLSRIVAAGWELAVTRSTGSTVIGLGAAPKLHWSIEPFVTG